MGQRVSDTITISAPPEAVYAVISDLPAYPEWAEGVESIEVLSQGEDGLPETVAFRVDARVAPVTYTLRYTHVRPERMSWTLVEGDMVSQLDGVYALEDLGDGTLVHYELEVDLSLPLPGFLMKRGARTVLELGLKGLRERVESR